MSAWDEAKSLSSAKIADLSKAFPGYSYQDAQRALATDEQLCTFLIMQIRESKGRLFELLHLLFDLQDERFVSKQLQALKDSMDIFSDEIKMRTCDLRHLHKDPLREIIRRDWELLDAMKRFRADLAKLEKTVGLVEHEPYYIKKYPQEWAGAQRLAASLKEQLRGLVIAFKEREVLCNIRPHIFEKTFRKLQEDIQAVV